MPMLILGMIVAAAAGWYFWYRREVENDFTPNPGYLEHNHKYDDFASAAYQRGDYAAVVDYCTRRLQEITADLAALFWRSQAYEAQGKYDQALIDVNALLRITPDDKIARLLRARIHQQMANINEAIEDINAAIRGGVHDALTYASRAGLYRQMGRMQEAITSATRAILIGTGNRITQASLHRLRGDLYSRTGRLDDALADFDTAIELDSSHPHSYLARSWVHYTLKDYTAAVVDCDRVVDLTDGKEMQAYFMRADCYMALEKFDEALLDYDQALERGLHNAWTLHNRAVIYRYRGEFVLAVADVTRAIDLAASEPQHQRDLYYLRSNLHMDTEQYADALADSELALALNTNHADSYVQRAFVHLRLKNHVACIADSNRALELSGGKSPQAYINRGAAYSELKDRERGLADMQQAIALNPELPFAYTSLAWLYNELYQPEAALQAIDRSLELDPGYVHALLTRGSSLYQLRRYDDALAEFTAALKASHPHDIYPLPNRASVYVQLRQYDEALADYTAAFQRSGEQHPRPLSGRAGVYSRQHAWEKAEADADRAIALAAPTDQPEYRMNKGWVFRLQKRYDEALVIYNEVLAETPDLARGYNNRAYLLAHMGRLDEALADAGQALRLDPTYPYAWATRGEIYFLMHRYDDALRDFEKSATIYSQHPFAIAGQAVTLHALGNGEAAKSLWRKLIELDARYASVDALIEDYHPAEPFIEAARKLIAEI